MKAPQENTQEPQKETVQRVEQESSTGGEATIADNRPPALRSLQLRSVNSEQGKNPMARICNPCC